MATSRTRSTTWTRGEKALFVSCGLLLVLAVAAALRWQTGNAVPPVRFPRPALPNPNAFVFYTGAGEALVHDREIGEAVSGRTAADFTIAEKRALVADNAAALRTLRDGLKLPYHEPPVHNADALFPHYARFRGLVRLLVLEGQTRAAAGDAAGAANSYLDAVQMGQQIPRGAPLIGSLVGNACQAIGRRPLWGLTDRLGSGAAKAAARRMERITANAVPLAEVLEQEKYFGQAGLLDLFDDPGRLRNVGDDLGAPRVVTPLVFFLFPKRTIMSSYTVFMDRTIARSHRPFAERGAEPPVPADPINRMLVPVLAPLPFQYAHTQAQNALLTVALALRAFRAEHGAYPRALDELVARGYLARLPDDPFAVKAPLRYRRIAPDRYVLYSVGPDGRDDNGKAIDDPRAARRGGGRGNDPRHQVEENSRGDVVAGVNPS
jgi:hypothetical protein